MKISKIFDSANNLIKSGNFFIKFGMSIRKKDAKLIVKGCGLGYRIRIGNYVPYLPINSY